MNSSRAAIQDARNSMILAEAYLVDHPVLADYDVGVDTLDPEETIISDAMGTVGNQEVAEILGWKPTGDNQIGLGYSGLGAFENNKSTHWGVTVINPKWRLFVNMWKTSEDRASMFDREAFDTQFLPQECDSPEVAEYKAFVRQTTAVEFGDGYVVYQFPQGYDTYQAPEGFNPSEGC